MRTFAGIRVFDAPQLATALINGPPARLLLFRHRLRCFVLGDKITNDAIIQIIARSISMALRVFSKPKWSTT